MSTFEELGLKKRIIQAVEDLNFTSPMPVQEKVIPHLVNDEHDDIITLAQTGTGKTAAFGLPMIQKVDTSKKKTQFLIISPTRELCLQIADDIKSYAKYLDKIKVVPVFGGASIDRQIGLIKKGAHIISATPGRLLDLINRRIIDIRHIDTVVLDEADEMLNMGFREDLEDILRETPAEKKTLLFSATMPKEVRKIANEYMHNPIEITIGKKNAGAENVNHVCYMVQARDRYLALKRIVDYHPDIYGIVFCRTRRETQEVADKLMEDGYNADALHGDLSQAQRDVVMNKFRIKHLHLLVATDVAARGLDVNDLTHVINYNLPDELEIYTHRSGRTGRAGKFGTSVVIAHLKEKGKLKTIEKMIGKKFANLPVPLGKEICERQLFHLIDRMEKVEVDDAQIDSFLPEINTKLEWLDRDELIKKFVSVEFNRFLDYYRNAPDLNKPKEEKNRLSKRGGSAGFTRFFINLGKMDGLKPADVIGMINDYTGTKNLEIGEIDIRKTYSFFEVDKAYTKEILSAFKNKRLKKREINVEVTTKEPKSNQSNRRGRKRSTNSSKPWMNQGRKSGRSKRRNKKSR